MAPVTRGRKGKSGHEKGRKGRQKDEKDSHGTNLLSNQNEDDRVDNSQIDPAITEQQQIDEDEMPESISFDQSKEDAYKLKAQYSKRKQQ